MGLSPRQVDDMSLWEFMACAEAWETANTPEDQRPMTQQQFDDAAALLRRLDGVS